MRDVDYDAQLLAQCHQLFSVPAQPPAGTEGGAAERVVVPRQREQPDAAGVEVPQRLGVTFQRVGALQAEDDGGRALPRAGVRRIPGRLRQPELGRMGGAQTVDGVDELEGVLAGAPRIPGLQDEAGEDLCADAGGAQVGQGDVEAGADLEVEPILGDPEDRVAVGVEEPYDVTPGLKDAAPR